MLIFYQEKINQNAQNIEKIAITETYSVASKVREMFKVLVKNKKFVFFTLFRGYLNKILQRGKYNW